MTIRILVADDQAIVRDGLVTMLGLASDIEVVGEARDGMQAVQLAAQVHPDVILMDLRMPILDGAGATSRVLATQPEVRILVLTTFADDESIHRALRAGALGYLTKDTGWPELLTAVRAAASGQAVFATQVRDRLVVDVARTVKPSITRRFPNLTAREAEVLGLVAKGLPNPRIADEIHVTTNTVKSYVTTILAKLDVTSRAEAIALVLDADRRDLGHTTA